MVTEELTIQVRQLVIDEEQVKQEELA